MNLQSSNLINAHQTQLKIKNKVKIDIYNNK